MSFTFILSFTYTPNFFFVEYVSHIFFFLNMSFLLTSFKTLTKNDDLTVLVAHITLHIICHMNPYLEIPKMPLILIKKRKKNPSILHRWSLSLSLFSVISLSPSLFLSHLSISVSLLSLSLSLGLLILVSLFSLSVSQSQSLFSLSVFQS